MSNNSIGGFMGFALTAIFAGIFLGTIARIGEGLRLTDRGSDIFSGRSNVRLF